MIAGTRRAAEISEPQLTRIQTRLYLLELFTQLDELSGQFWSCSFVFVFEKHEGRFPLLRANPLDPAGEICLAVIYTSQPQVTPVRRLVDVVQRQVVSIRDAQHALVTA